MDTFDKLLTFGKQTFRIDDIRVMQNVVLAVIPIG